ncbi:Uncharacterised protein [Mycobacterium tuberculosis]|nr:Uncharacterised protein [Mycobacterium tuberculosis]
MNAIFIRQANGLFFSYVVQNDGNRSFFFDKQALKLLQSRIPLLVR